MKGLRKTFYQQLDLICLRPNMFLRKKSIFYLDCYLMGYQDFAILHNIPLKESYHEKPNFYFFNQFIKDKFKQPSSTLGWSEIIFSVSEKNEELAFDNFFELLYEYKNSHIHDATNI